jgi:YYY domain-containing protein
VIADYDIFGNFQEVIDEFPFFSFYLGDLHPHVLVLPFVFIALALSLNLFLSPPEAGNRFHIFRFEYTFSRRVFFLGALVFGALGFLNLWDFPWYVVIFAGVHLLIKVDRAGWSRFRVYEFFVLVVALGISGVLAYLPFYISFSSQAGGILPNVINPTRGVHLWIMFGTLFVPLLAFLFYLIQKRGDEKILLKGMTLALAVALTLFGLSGLFSSLLGGGLSVGMVSQVSNPFLSMYGVESVRALLQEGLTRRASSIFSAITLVVLLGIGAALVIIPEFFYLRDLFGNRMNTIFKFYYQAWILWALAAAYGSAVMLSLPKSKRSLAVVYSLILAVVMFIGLTYPVMGLQTRYNFYLNPDEHAAVDWLRQAPLGTLVEAVHPTGGSYSQYARISMNSGQPALLGWVGHEGQWRGGGEEMGTRQDDIALLYSSGNWQEAFQIIEQYRIVYVVVGNLERTTYDVDEDKFIRNLIPVFQQGSVTIYQVQVLDE